MRIACEECGKQFSKPTKIEAERAVRMHKGRVHGNISNHSRTPSSETKRPETTNGRRQLTPEQIEHRRQYQKDRRARLKRAKDGPLAQTYGFHYCFNCGAPIGLAEKSTQAAISLVR